MKPELLTLHINGRPHVVALAPNVTLLHALRDLGYMDVKCGCEQGDCGACAVLVDGVAVNSCLVLAGQTDGCTIVTAAGLGSVKQPHPLHEAFADLGAIQCGYCTPGFIIAAKALLDTNPHPTEAEIREAISGNLCRCTGYGQIVEAIQAAAETLCVRSAQNDNVSILSGAGVGTPAQSKDASLPMAAPSTLNDDGARASGGDQ